MANNQSQKILMYHSVVSRASPVPPGREVGAELYNVTADVFKMHMNALVNRGIKGVLYDPETAESSQDIVITFDDGEMNNYSEAMPVLKEFGFKGYFFIIAKRVGREGYMGWDEIRALHENGMVVGSHGLSHEILTNLLDTQIEEELTASKKNLERNLDIEVNDLSIPRGFCNDKIIQMAYDAGYKNIFISDRPARLTQPCLTRLAVKGNWSMDRFERLLDDRVPFSERVKDRTKGLAKFVLRESGYNFFRGLVIKIIR